MKLPEEAVVALNDVRDHVLQDLRDHISLMREMMSGADLRQTKGQ